MGRRQRHISGHGFTLVEVLVALGILVVIISVLIPTLAQARSRANTAMCINNLRQLGSALIAYATENNQVIPRRGQGASPTTIITRADDWFNCLPPLIGMDRFDDLKTKKIFPKPQSNSIWCCPELRENAFPACVDGSGVVQPYFWSYGMNMWMGAWYQNKIDRLAAIDSPSTMVAFADGPGNYCSVLPSNKPYSPVARHNGKVNICFLDGHTDSMTASYVGVGVGLVEHSDIRWKVPTSAWPGPPP